MATSLLLPLAITFFLRTSCLVCIFSCTYKIRDFKNSFTTFQIGRTTRAILLVDLMLEPNQEANS